MAPRYKRNIVSDAVISIVSDLRLRGKWVSSLTLEDALKQRYDFGDHLELTSMPMNRVMTALVPVIYSLQQSSNGVYHIQHSYIVHDGKKKRIHLFYFQDEEKAPPRHPSIDESWDKIHGHHSSILQSLKQKGTRHQHKKQGVGEKN
jgi:hypothetical protein